MSFETEKIEETQIPDQHLSKKENTAQVIKFTLFSISAGIIETLSFTLLNEVFHLPYMPCYLTALILSVIWNFTLNREFTFKSANNVPLAMLKVACFHLVGNSSYQRRLERIYSALRHHGREPYYGVPL